MSALLVRTDATTVNYVPLWSSVGSYPAKIAVRTASNTIQYAGVSKTHARDSCLRMRLADGSVGYVRRAPNDTITCGFSGNNFIDRSGHTWTKDGSPSITTISGVKCLKCFDGAYIKLEDTITLPKASKFFYRYQFYTASTNNEIFATLVRMEDGSMSAQHMYAFWNGGGIGRQCNGNSGKLIDCTLNAWHWMVITYNNGTWTQYLDGKAVGSTVSASSVKWTLWRVGPFSNSYYANLQVFIGGLPGRNGGYINTGTDTDATTYIDMRF